jgi:hypothetical protein
MSENTEKAPERFIVLRGIEEGNVFWSTMRSGETEEQARYLNDGTLAYDVLLVTEDEQEARKRWAQESPWGWLTHL